MTGAIIRREPLGFPWAGTDPFLLCTHHLEKYPAASGNQGVAPDKLRGRPLGNDFTGKDGYNMYHGTSVPGFPAHPHRGFETVTIVLKGLVDHTDSMGAKARYGDGDVQWLTAGHGILHCEMFPLRDRVGENPLDFYQIWLNLPAARKMSDPAFRMLWDSSIPLYRFENANGTVAQVKVIAGTYAPQEQPRPTLNPLSPTPDSWASEAENEVAIWEITLEPGAALTLPPATREGTRRTLYFHTGDRLRVAGQDQSNRQLIEVIAQRALELANDGAETARIMLLQGVPINEPVVAHGPFVMNSTEEIHQAHRDFRDTRFGGWPWEQPGPVHEAGRGRFAKYPDRLEPDLPPE